MKIKLNRKYYDAVADVMGEEELLDYLNEITYHVEDGSFTYQEMRIIVAEDAVVMNLDDDITAYLAALVEELWYGLQPDDFWFIYSTPWDDDEEEEEAAFEDWHIAEHIW